MTENALSQTIFIVDSTVCYGPVILATLIWIEDAYDQTVSCDQRLNACDVISKLDAFTATISLRVDRVVHRQAFFIQQALNQAWLEVANEQPDVARLLQPVRRGTVAPEIVPGTVRSSRQI